MSSCGASSSKSSSGSSSFYCGVAGYTCVDPTYSSVIVQVNTTDTSLADTTTMVQSEYTFQGTALLVASVQRNARDVSSWFQYLTWSALDLSAANVQIKRADIVLPKPPKPPAPPVPPHRAPSASYQQSKVAVAGKSINALIFEQGITETGTTLYEGERWAVTSVQSVSQLHRQHGAVVATVSWTMSFQKYQLVNAQDSQGKSMQSVSGIDTLAAASQPSANWLTSDVLERSVRYFAYSSKLRSMNDVRVCTINMVANGTVDSSPFSELDIMDCAQNYTVTSYNQPLQALYDSVQCQERQSDAWQNRYGKDGYAEWLIVYTVLWILVGLIALREFVKSVCRPSCANSNCCLSRKHARLLNHDHADTAHLANEEVDAVEGFASTTQIRQLSGRRHHRRRVLERILTFYSTRSGMNEPNEENSNDQSGKRWSMLTNFWEMLRIPGFFSKSMFSMLVICVASLRVSHYFWILSAYLTSISDQHSDNTDVSMAKDLLVCREFSFLTNKGQMESEDNQDWTDAYLMCLWMIGFHACLCWTLVTAVARYVHSTIRKSMVSLSLPFLPTTPAEPANTGNSSNLVASSSEGNPLSSLLPNPPISEATLTASALSGPVMSNFLDNSLRPNGSLSEFEGSEAGELHSSLVPTLFHFQVVHFLSISITMMLVTLAIVWLVVAVVIQKSPYTDEIHKHILVGVTGQGVELFLHWVQRITGAISIIEAIVLLTVSHWLARMQYLILQRRPILSEENNLAVEGMDRMYGVNIQTWICIYLVAVLLFLQGLVTIVISHDYFHQAGSQVDFYEQASHENDVHVTTVFSFYSLGLRILELLAIVAVSFLTIYQDKLFLLSSTATMNGVLGHGSGLSTPYYSDLSVTGENSPTNLFDSAKRADNQKKEGSTSNDIEMKNSTSVGQNRFFVFGYGYEGAGPVWLNLNWALYWQKQEGKSSQESDNLQRSTIKNDEESGESRGELHHRSPSIETTTSERSWFGWPTFQDKGKTKDLQLSAMNKNDDEDAMQFMWTTNPLSSMSSAYQPISRTSANANSVDVSDSNSVRNSKQWAASPSNVSFHFPQLSSASSSVVLSDSIPDERSTMNESCTSLKSESAVVPTSVSPVNGLSGSWPTSLSAHRSTTLSRIIRIGREQNKLSASSQSIQSEEVTKESSSQVLKPGAGQDSQSVTVNTQESLSPGTQTCPQY